MRKKTWFIAIDQVKVGPFLTETIQSLLQLKRLVPSDLAWSEGMPTWARISDCEEFSRPSSLGPAAGPESPPAKRSPPELTPRGSQAVAPHLSGPRQPGESAPVYEYRNGLRRFKRSAIQGDLVTEDGKTYPIVNISEGGVLASASDLPPVGSALFFSLRSAPLGEPFRASGWITRHAIAPPFLGFGLEFAEIDPANRDRIRRFIESQLDSAGTPASQ